MLMNIHIPTDNEIPNAGPLTGAAATAHNSTALTLSQAMHSVFKCENK